MPPELQEYYAAEGRHGNWMAWVLGLVTLMVTVAVALGLFYGGRWAYRKVRNDDKKQVATKQNEASKQSVDKDDSKDEASSDDSATSSTDNKSTSTTTPQTSSTSTSTPSSTPTPTTTATKGSSNIPNTGPEGTITVFVAVTLLAYVLHRRFLTD
jgi:hypothetical protein